MRHAQAKNQRPRFKISDNHLPHLGYVVIRIPTECEKNRSIFDTCGSEYLAELC